MVDSISQIENPIDENIKTAIFYSISDLGDYLVEIRYQNEHYFLLENGKSKQFQNMASARKAALQHGAEQGFIALSKTYQEVEAETLPITSSKQENRYDYIKTDLGL